jgi:hypothetical protein
LLEEHPAESLAAWGFAGVKFPLSQSCDTFLTLTGETVEA